MPHANKSWVFLIVLSGLCGLAQNASARNDFSVGVEGFRDHYEEPAGVDVDEHSNYGSIDASYTNTNDQGFISKAEWRGSYGKDDYKSPSGTIDGIPQYETELRLTTGITIPFNQTDSFIPYLGLGTRFFYDNAKGYVTNLDKFGYDRRILQFYVPLGATAHFVTANGWTYSPMIEVDPLLLGKVNSRLQNGGQGDPNYLNTQHDGYGIRGEFMLGQQYKDFGWEVGPFIRYWHINDSKFVPAGPNLVLYEPKNTRLQAGLGARVNF